MEKDGSRIRVNVANQKENEKAGKKKAAQSTGFRKAACCPLNNRTRAAGRNNGLCEGKARGDRDPQKVHFDSTQMGSGTAPPR